MSAFIETLTGCGLSCGQCPNYSGERKPICKGCKESEGNPWWGACELYKCIVNHGVEHCGQCNEFPCDRLSSGFDPNNPAGQMNAVIRIGVSAYRKKHGDKKTAELLHKLGPPKRPTK